MVMKPPVIAGKYTLLRRLGHGGMAEVFLAKQMSEGGFEKLVVLKRILPHLASGPEFVTMFLDEARVAADLRHPNIVTIADVGRVGETLFMVMEFLHGQDVRKVQRKVAAFGQMIPFGHACQMVIDAAAGLHYAHTKRDLNGQMLSIVHRDVSPQNIIVTFEGGTKIVDFGIAKAAGQSTQTSAGVLKGKYTYMSPEQAQGEIVDARTDQFALGIVLWELLTMRRLFKRDTEGQTLEAIIDGAVPRPKRFRDDCPPGIEDVVTARLWRSPSKTCSPKTARCIPSHASLNTCAGSLPISSPKKPPSASCKPTAASPSKTPSRSTFAKKTTNPRSPKSPNPNPSRCRRKSRRPRPPRPIESARDRAPRVKSNVAIRPPRAAAIANRHPSDRATARSRNPIAIHHAINPAIATKIAGAIARSRRRRQVAEN